MKVITLEVAMLHMKIRKIGNSYGVILPKEMLNDLGATEGSEIIAHKSPNGYTIYAGDPKFEAQMKIARQVMDEYRDVLRELAK
jgi:putative addiction module antidote